MLFSCTTLKDVELLIGAELNSISLHAFDPGYFHFTMPKSNGELRYIEAPENELKRLQRKLNRYLQCAYFVVRTPSCYGFTIGAITEKNPRNILSNAQKHLNCSYLINVDVDDFFHQISTERVQFIFESDPFRFDRYTSKSLAKLCTYKGRLPMGAPTSPVLSNFYTIEPDTELQKWSENQAITYTRFVDDLTFSSTKNLNSGHIESISGILNNFNLPLNSGKQKLYGPEDPKTVTGLLVGNSVEIAQSFYFDLNEDLVRLKKVVEVHQITGMTSGLSFLKRFKQEVMGKINFVKQIKGKFSEEYIRYLEQFHEALEPDERFVARWTNFNNYV
ncbi:MAG: reverse transcriptase family protein [Crocinitomicaceae bacterium]